MVLLPLPIFMRPFSKYLLNFFGPFDLPSAFVTEFVLQKDFSFAVFAEEAFLLLEFFG